MTSGNMYFYLLLLLFASAFAADDAVKNHRAEKRQDSSYVVFGGWRPVKSNSDIYHGSASGRYHDLISALPGSLDATASLYTHALPSSYSRDIYNYYPRPAIKHKPKKNTPVYVERLQPKRQQSKQGGRNTVSGGSPQYIDIQKLDLKHFQDLQDIILQAKQLPLTQLSLPNSVGKQFEIVEVAVQPYQQNNYGTRITNRYSRQRNAQRNNKGSYARIPQNLSPSQLPLQFQYISVPKINSLVPQILPKHMSITPVKISHSVPSVDSLLGNIQKSLKNIQVVEVPVPAAVPISISSKHGGGSQYGKRNNAYSQQQYRTPSQKYGQKVSFPANTYYSHQAEKPRNQYPAPSQSKSNYGQQAQMPQIEAELIKLSEHQVQDLLKNLQVVKQNTRDFLKILPIADAAHKTKSEQVQLVVALPQGGHGQNVEASAYESQGQDSGYGKKQQYSIPVTQQVSYPSHDASITQTSGGYQISSQNQGVEHNAAGYQIDSGRVYEQASYQSVEGQSNYGQNTYEVSKNGYATAEGQGYSQQAYDAPAPQDSQNHRDQYIEVMSPPADETGYRREPVLAVEIQRGQTIEDAIKAIDPETLQRLGAHGKDGLEIEVVEVPVDEYSSGSEKKETYVSSSNSTTKVQAKKTISVAKVSNSTSTATDKKS